MGLQSRARLAASPSNQEEGIVHLGRKDTEQPAESENAALQSAADHLSSLSLAALGAS